VPRFDQRTEFNVKKFILIAILASLSSLNLPTAHADWDPVREAQDAAERKASQERNAREKAAVEKRKRDAMQMHMREFVGKDAVGKSDADVERIYKQRRADIDKQAAALEAVERAEKKNPRKPGREGDMAQGDAAMKAMYGKSTSEIGNMSEKERDAFFKELQSKYPK
jgi:hypothetical protein